MYLKHWSLSSQITWFVYALRHLEFLMDNIMDEPSEDKNNTPSFQELC